jgi:hypothetical protein
MPKTPKQPKQKTRHEPLRLGDLVATAFEEAMRITTDPTRAATLAAAAVKRILVARGELHLVRELTTVH